MPVVKPFAGLRPNAKFAQEVIAPPYDVLTTEEARSVAADQPNNFLHVSKPEIDLPADVSPYDTLVYDTGAENLRRLVRRGVLIQDPRECLYLYRMQTAAHAQTGVVATVSVTDYHANRIRRHELTRPDKEDDRVRHMEALNAQTGPVLLVHQHDSGVAERLAGLTRQVPLYEGLRLNDVEHTLWAIEDQAAVDALRAAFNEMPAFYIADGHHRSAAAARVAERRGPEDRNANHFLAVLFPASEVRILDYNRVIKTLNGRTPAGFVDRVARRFTVTEAAGPVRPQRPGEFGMCLAGRWYRLTAPASQLQADDPVARLDVSILSEQVIEPLLGIHDMRRDPHIDFVGGARGLRELECRVDGGDAVAFSMYPTPLSALIQVADAGRVMPPKSTWFEPKLADGLVSHLLGR